jgi:hypothetical protein
MSSLVTRSAALEARAGAGDGRRVMGVALDVPGKDDLVWRGPIWSWQPEDGQMALAEPQAAICRPQAGLLPARRGLDPLASAGLGRAEVGALYEAIRDRSSQLGPQWRAAFEAAFPEHKAALPRIDSEALRLDGGSRLFGAMVRQRDAAAVLGAIEELRAAGVVPGEAGAKRGHSSFPSNGSEKGECPLLLSTTERRARKKATRRLPLFALMRFADGCSGGFCLQPSERGSGQRHPLHATAIRSRRPAA